MVFGKIKYAVQLCLCAVLLAVGVWMLSAGKSGGGKGAELSVVSEPAESSSFLEHLTGFLSDNENSGGRKLALSLWSWIYPASNIDAIEEMPGASGLPWPAYMVLQSIPVYRYGSGEEEPVKMDDPAYPAYVANVEFYKTHSFVEMEEAGMPVQDGMAAEQVTGENAVGDSAQEAASQKQDSVLQIGAGKGPGKIYSLAQLVDYDFMMKNFYNVHPSTTAGRDLMKADNFLDKDFTLQSDGSQPQILIYHSHSQEEYADYHSGNREATIVHVGKYLTSLLEAKGYQVIHDTSVYDFRDGKLDRNKAYTYALEGIQGILTKNPSVDVIIDLHRDGVNSDLHMVSEVNGKTTAPIMFFNGISQTPTGPIEYLSNPYKEDNLAFSFQLQLKAAEYYPDWLRKIYLKGLRYNMHLRPRSLLVEVGAQTNTSDEALNAMEPLAEVLDMVLRGQ